MLLYDNGKHRRHIFQIFGSTFYRRHIFVLGILVAAMVSALQVLEAMLDIQLSLPHQYPHQLLGGIVTFAVVFRLNQSWSRYWEAVTNLHIMYSKWADSFSQFCAFLSVTIQKTHEREGTDDEDMPEKVSLLEDIREKVENDFLLLSAMACDRICRGDCAQMQRRHDLRSGAIPKKRHQHGKRIKWENLVVLREDLRKGEDLTDSKGMPEFVESKCSRSEILDDEKDDDVEVHSLWNPQYVVRKPPKGAKYNLLQVSSDRCNMVVNWLNHNLAYAQSMLETPAPIQSRMYQEISNGMLGFNNVMKIADVPFPFAVDQLIVILLVVWMFSVPFFIITFTESWFAGPLFAFLCTTFMLSINDTARELENPFGLTPNKICVPEFHSRFALVVRDAVRSSNNPPRPPQAKMRESQKLRYAKNCTSKRKATAKSESDWKTTISNLSIDRSLDISPRSIDISPQKERTDISPDSSLFLRGLYAIESESRSTKLSPDGFLAELDDDNVDAMAIVAEEISPGPSYPRSLHSVPGISSQLHEKSSQHVQSNLRYLKLESPRGSPHANFASANAIGMQAMFQQLAQVSERVEQQLNSFSSQLKYMSSPVAQSRLIRDDPKDATLYMTPPAAQSRLIGDDPKDSMLFSL